MARRFHFGLRPVPDGIGETAVVEPVERAIVRVMRVAHRRDVHRRVAR